jgi:cytochrome P450
VNADGCPAWVADFDIITDQKHHDDPYPNYAELRATCPVAYSKHHGGHWIITRHADISAVLRDAEMFSSRQAILHDKNSGMLPAENRGPDGLDLGEPFSLTTMDPPRHTAYKRLLMPLFSTKKVDGWRPAIRAAAIGLLEKIRTKGSCEFTHDFAVELPILVFLDILGVPSQDRHILQDIHERLHLFPFGLITPEEMKSYQVEELVYFARLLEEKASNPPNDTVISYLNHAEVDGRPLTLQEKMRLCQQFSRAGLHTTTAVLSNMMCYLATHPSQRDRLVSEPAIIPNAVEELMRFESMAAPGRTATRDVELHGQHIRAGDMVVLPTGSAGRDSTVFDHPDEVDFDRTDIDHLMFGMGRHYCVGKHLARAELRISMEEIHRLIPKYRLMDGRTPKRVTALERATIELWLDF